MSYLGEAFGEALSPDGAKAWRNFLGPVHLIRPPSKTPFKTPFLTKGGLTTRRGSY